MKRGLAWILTLVVAVLTVPEATKAAERFLKMSTTTSTENSGGQGMGKTLTYAEEKQAYTLAERGTYLKYKFGREQGLDLKIVCEGDAELFNPYGAIPINPKRHPHVKFKWADGFAQWLISLKAQSLIARYKIKGQQAFFPDAIPHTK